MYILYLFVLAEPLVEEKIQGIISLFSQFVYVMYSDSEFQNYKCVYFMKNCYMCTVESKNSCVI